jgi:hypothetical protein
MAAVGDAPSDTATSEVAARAGEVPGTFGEAQAAADAEDAARSGELEALVAELAAKETSEGPAAIPDEASGQPATAGEGQVESTTVAEPQHDWRRLLDPRRAR